MDFTEKWHYPGGHGSPVALPKKAPSPSYPEASIWSATLHSPLTQSSPAPLIQSTLERQPQQGSLQEGWWCLTDMTACPQGRESAPWAT